VKIAHVKFNKQVDQCRCSSFTLSNLSRFVAYVVLCTHSTHLPNQNKYKLHTRKFNKHVDQHRYHHLHHSAIRPDSLPMSSRGHIVPTFLNGNKYKLHARKFNKQVDQRRSSSFLQRQAPQRKTKSWRLSWVAIILLAIISCELFAGIKSISPLLTHTYDASTTLLNTYYVRILPHN